MTPRRRKPRPPRLAESLLRRVLSPADRDFMLGDLFEQYRRRRSRAGRLRADAWYLHQLLACLIPSLRHRIASRGPGGTRPRSTGRKWTPVLDMLRQDLRDALRAWTREPGWTAAAVLTLALGIGATTAIFTVVDGVLLEPLPYDTPGRLMAVTTWLPEQQRQGQWVAWPTWTELRQRQDVFEDLAAWGTWDQTVVLDGAAEEMHAAQVSASLFPVLRVQPALGRGFREEDDAEGAFGTVVLSHGLWQRRFGGDPGVLGRSITVDERPHAVVGVMGPGFAFPDPRVQFWTSLAHGFRTRTTWYLSMLGRLRPGVSPAQAADRLAATEFTLTGGGVPDRTYQGRAEPLHRSVVGNVRPLLLIFMASVAAVLSIACLNVVNLTLTRAAGRERERSVRAALGASRWRLAGQTLTESVTVSLAGAALGLLLALVLTDTLVAMSPVSVPRRQEIGVDGGALGFALALAVGVGTVIGLVSASGGARAGLATGLYGRRGGSRGRSTQRLRSGLVVVQLGLAVVLLFSGGLLLRSFAGLLAVERGYEVDRVLTFSTSVPSGRYPDFETRRELYAGLRERIEALPGVEVASLAHVLPYGGRWRFGVAIDGLEPADDESPASDVLYVTSGFFDALSIPLLEGRTFRDAETGVTVVNRTLTRRYLAGRPPLGATITFGDSAPARVIGVVDDTRYVDLDEEPTPQAYLPYADGFTGNMMGVVRTAGNPSTLAGPVRELVAARDPEIAVSELMTLRERLTDSVSGPRFRTLLLGAFAMAALGLAVVGVYGVMAHTVTRRTREMGIRMALGADRRRILTVVVRHAALLALLGLAVGATGSWAAAGLLESYLFGVQTRDPVTFAGVALVLSAAALVACWIPARRAAGIDPMVALRAD